MFIFSAGLIFETVSYAIPSKNTRQKKSSSSTAIEWSDGTWTQQPEEA